MKAKILKVQHLVISEHYIGQRLDNFLFSYLKGVPKSKIYRILRTGQIRVNKKRTKYKYKLIEGDTLRIPPLHILETKKIFLSPNRKEISILEKAILFEDNHILILNKPSGIAVHGGSGLSFGVIEGLRLLRPNSHLELVHRLDRDTSGLLLLAQKRSALRSLHEQLRTKEVRKEYLALVQGKWPPNCKIATLPILKKYSNNQDNIVCIDIHGKASETHFSVEEYFNDATLLKVRPITGRTHQIRIHTSYLGHPIAFDNRYGLSNFDKKIIKTGLNRMFLHAHFMKFKHPHSGQLLKFHAPLDKNLQNCLINLRNQNS
ncbi:23S rRNA pseudouridine(955/2504/2580) synthase RluC [Candidatus Ishikawella capsulata]|uniref:Pseudouridine synthase n=1 Tax=Candidatus Ishikawaella capsulata Mpkobe TaxID=476281 RepID=C5WD20_9ENTR|nr:23S rRNA pseudouridine(955/2504/2580) synthase RluC [Candidatus Ishikawaella capsulata]BAH83226.1 23S rRNA pseudouridylate synthase [Candidatus Ishikawaella capsulata Mpkobe]